jgi:hypothetical protein
MATGDVTNAIILSTGDQLTLDIEGLSTGGTYNFGLGNVNGTPTDVTTGTPKVVVTLTSLSFDDSGNATTATRTLWGTYKIRKPYSNQAVNQESVGGSPSKVTVTIDLNEYVYSSDTSITVKVLSGLYTQASTPNNAAASLTATNNSTLAHGRVVGGWSMPGCDKITTTTWIPRFTAFQHFGQLGRPVRGVKITATDGTHTVTATVLNPSYDASFGDTLPVVDYHPVMDLSTLTPGVITFNAKAWGWFGDSSSVLDTSDGVAGTYLPSVVYSPLKYVYDPNNTYCTVVAVVDSINGHDSGGSVGVAVTGGLNLGSPPLPFASIGAAYTAIKTLCNSTYSRNNGGGAVIYLKDNGSGGRAEYDWCGNAGVTGGTTPQCSLVIRNYPGATAYNCAITTSASGNAQQLCTLVKFQGIAWDDKNSSSPRAPQIYCGANSTTPFQHWFDQCYINLRNGSTATLYNAGLVHVTRCTVPNWAGSGNCGLGQYNTNSYTMIGVVRGNDFANGGGSVGQVQAQIFLGNRAGAWYQLTDVIQGSSIPAYTGNVVAYNKISAAISSGTALISMRNGALSDTFGIAIVQNNFENYAAVSGKTVSVAADSSSGSPVYNCMIWNNTSTGREMSLAYNEYGGGAYIRSNWSIKNNILDGFSIKGDLFGLNTTGTAVVTGGTSVVVTASGHGYQAGQQVVITAATATSANYIGTWTLTAVTSSTFSFTTSGTVSNATVTFGGSGARTGNFPIVYGCGCANNTVGQLGLTASGSFSQQFFGLNSWTASTPSEPANNGGVQSAAGAASSLNFPSYVNRQAAGWNGSSIVAGTGGGDYHLQPTSTVQRQLMTTDFLIPFDLDGLPRSANARGGAYADSPQLALLLG